VPPTILRDGHQEVRVCGAPLDHGHFAWELVGEGESILRYIPDLKAIVHEKTADHVDLFLVQHDVSDADLTEGEDLL
jgi:hypothetical protein